MTSGRPSPDPWAPLPDKYVSPARRLRPRTLLVITIAGVLLLAGFGYAVGSLFDSGDPRPKSSPGKGAIPPWCSPTPTPIQTPTPSASTTSPPDFAKIADICALLPRNTTMRLVGNGKDIPDSDPPTWRCSRYHEQNVGGVTLAHNVDFDITLGSNAVSSSTTFAELREEARTRSNGLNYRGAKLGPMENVPDVGDEAYYQYETEGFDDRTGIVVARVRNAIIEVDYGSYTYSSDATSTRMADKTARSGAIEIIRGIIKALIK